MSTAEVEPHNDPLHYYIERVLPGDRGEPLLAADQRLQRINYRTHRKGIENFISMDEVSEDLDTIDRITDVLIHALAEIFTEHGVYVHRLQALEIFTLFYDTLFDSYQQDDTGEILDIIEEGGSSEEVFAELCAYLHGGHPEDYLAYIVEIHPELIEKLRKVCVEIQENDPTADELSAEIQAQEQTPGAFSEFNRFYRHFKPAPLTELLDDGIRLGLDFESYFTRLYNQETQSLELAAELYLGASLASGESFAQARERVSSRLEPYFDDLRELQKLIDYVRQKIEVLGHV